MVVPSAKLGAVSLDHVATFKEDEGPSQIERLRQRRQVTITANMREGYAQGEALGALEREIAAMSLEPGYGADKVKAPRIVGPIVEVTIDGTPMVAG